MAADQQTLREVQTCLEPYDIQKNRRLAAQYPDGQYPHTRRCAILVPLFVSRQDGQLHVLLTQRASTLRSHASNVAFPGGAQDASDRDDTHTALREAHEEIGLDPGDVTVIAHLPPMFVRFSNSVYPVVGFIPSDFQPKPNPDEVALVFSAPLRRFLEKDVSYGNYELFGQMFRTVFLMHVVKSSAPLLIWGVTCTICVAVSRAILGPRKRFKLFLGKAGQASSSSDHDDDDELDDNVFGDVEKLYHFLCKSSVPSSKL
ncbi:hypothetical protein BaRGS_00016516 [Batillaria attramentaria]|uniref:Nudix hydrolase domain-containing protein n=1 Tax=Batillaria attramentaria TaxID=370345 RepID=A0ABD0KZJ4_9CAEN